jgi:hypothetical protein
MENLHQSTWDREILYADGSSKDVQLSMRPLLQKSTNTNMAGSWKLKFTFCVTETTHELLLIDKWSLVQ